MAKNNQKKEKALRNLENARKYRKKSSDKRRRFGGPRPAAPAAQQGQAPQSQSAAPAQQIAAPQSSPNPPA